MCVFVCCWSQNSPFSVICKMSHYTHASMHYVDKTERARKKARNSNVMFSSSNKYFMKETFVSWKLKNFFFLSRALASALRFDFRQHIVIVWKKLCRELNTLFLISQHATVTLVLLFSLPHFPPTSHHTTHPPLALSVPVADATAASAVVGIVFLLLIWSF